MTTSPIERIVEEFEGRFASFDMKHREVLHDMEWSALRLVTEWLRTSLKDFQHTIEDDLLERIEKELPQEPIDESDLNLNIVSYPKRVLHAYVASGINEALDSFRTIITNLKHNK